MFDEISEDSICSPPTYGHLSACNGTYQVLVADAEGAQAVLDMRVPNKADFFKHAHIIYVPHNGGTKYVNALQALHAKQFYISPSVTTALLRLQQTLSTARMGTQLYLTGTEGLIGQAMQIALEAGMEHTSIQTEHRGSRARRVQCIHCKGITEDVTTQPVTCSHCGVLLFVRDHYSRRYAAFQGVCINAEDPSSLPEKEEVFR